MSTTKTVYFSLGSNLGNRLAQLQRAIFMLGSRLGPVNKISSVYESKSWGFEAGDFLNICIAVDTRAAPETILDQLLEIEASMGRKRRDESGYVSRNIDIDILYYGQEIVNKQDLIIPHPQLQNRRFVLKPLADIAPQFYNPQLQKDTRNLLQECKDRSKVNRTSHLLFKSRHDLFAQLHFLAIEGNIGAGKTTLAEKIADDFKAKLILERFADNPFLPKFYEDQSRYAFPLEMSFLADRFQQFTDDTSQFDLFKNFMVSDYDVFKSLIFAEITLQNEEFSLYKQLFNFMYKEVKKPDLYVYLYQDTQRLLDNIKKRGREYERNIRPDYLDQINKGYLHYVKTYPHKNSLIIDVSDLDFVKNPTDYEVIISNIENQILNN
ncbi:MAG: 2-amino-4-hydroxy-6-hydroxymethyldihydropteridine diphosphokinase [Flavobacteriaceae bacterium]